MSMDLPKGFNPKEEKRYKKKGAKSNVRIAPGDKGNFKGLSNKHSADWMGIIRLQCAEKHTKIPPGFIKQLISGINRTV